MTPTPEQNAITSAISAGKNVIANALAGTAKSTTAVLSVATIPRSQSVCILTFSKKTEQDMTGKIKEAGLERPNLFVKTYNGLGHQALMKASGRRLILDNDKIYKIAKTKGLYGDALQDLMFLTRRGRLAGIIPTGTLGKGLVPDTEESWSAICQEHDLDEVLIKPAREILTASNKLALQGEIDFDDQIYITTLIYGSYQKYDSVILDEAQDTSHLNWLQVQKCAPGQLSCFGDKHQAIYAWRGAGTNSMEDLRRLREDWEECYLSTTFRCPRAVVARQQSFVPRFNAAPGNLEGDVTWPAPWWPKAGEAILCRNNAPLIKLAFRLLKNQVGVNYLGKDLGRNLKSLYNKVSLKGKRSHSQVLDEIAIQQQTHPHKYDRLESLAVMLGTGRPLDETLQILTASKTHAVTLATGHQAKGLEWSVVHHLNPDLIPSRFAETPTELQQEDNLRYVIETRTREHLRLVDLMDCRQAEDGMAA